MNEKPVDWLAAFLFAHDESMRAFDALADGDTDTAQGLLDSAQSANRVAASLHAESRAQ